jgi:glycosyltransferase involved in cell wall biosynthesis
MTTISISWAFPPMNYPRATQVDRLIRHLEIDEHIVVSAQLGDTRRVSSEHLSEKVLLYRIPEYLGIGKLKRFARFIPLLGKCPDAERMWAYKAARFVINYLGMTAGDTLITFGSPMSDHLAGLKIKTKTSCLWVAHFSDPWVDNEFRGRRGLKNYFNGRMEKKVIRDCDAVIFTSQETKELVMKKYPIAWQRKVHVVPHSFVAPNPRQYQTPNVDEPIRIRHLGNFYGHRSPQPLFSALAHIQAKLPEALDHFVVDLVGNVPRRLARSKELETLPSGIVNFYGSVSYEDSLELMRTSDVLLVIDAPSEVSVFLPSKLVEYLTWDRPIIGFTPNGAAANLIISCGGLCADPSDEIATAGVLLNAVSLAEARRQKPQLPWAPAEVRNRYLAPNVAKLFGDILEDLKTKP